MTFTDDDLERLKSCAELTHLGTDWFDYWHIKELLARLEAAEAALNSCKRYTYEDGLVIVEEPSVDLYEAWRKAAGK